MKQKKYIRRRRKSASGTPSNAPFKTGAIASFVAVTLCACIGVTVAFAGSGASDSSTFGLAARSQDLDYSLMSVIIETNAPTIQEGSLLSSATSRDITAGIAQIEEAEEATRLKAEEEAAAEKEAEKEAAEKARLEAEEETRIAEEAQAAETSAKTQETSGDWQTGSASAYNIASSSTSTASGTPLDESSLTVAVPASQSYLLGRSVEISWNGISVVATVTDTGAFDDYGRALDLAPGVCIAFGIDTSGSASNCEKWGVQTVKYRFL